jgi:hypothetical protein
MNLLDNTQNQIKNITKTLLKPSNISYGFIGLTTVLLGYYTFFENNIENPLPDTLASPSESAASSLNPFASSEPNTASTASSLNPFASSEPNTASSEPNTASSLNPFASDEKPIISGGKRKLGKKTKKSKK